MKRIANTVQSIDQVFEYATKMKKTNATGINTPNLRYVLVYDKTLISMVWIIASKYTNHFINWATRPVSKLKLRMTHQEEDFNYQHHFRVTML